MRRFAAPFLFCLWPMSAMAAEFTSLYTKFDLETCSVIEKGDEHLYAGTWSCPGFKGIDVIQASADDRSFAGFGKGGAKHCSFRKTFSPFNTALSPVEWRLRDGVPIAAIERWRVTTDDVGGTVTWLVVNALRQDDSCHAHYVAGSYPNANEQARRAADDLAEDFNCASGVPTVDSKIGPPPIEMLACRDMAAE